MPVVPRPSVADKHPYILTGHDTCSAPGAFAHDLQALRCARVAGEVEEGSRNEALPVEPTFHCSIPFKTLAFLTTPEGVLKIAEPLAESAQLPNGRGRSDFSEPGQNPFRRPALRASLSRLEGPNPRSGGTLAGAQRPVAVQFLRRKWSKTPEERKNYRLQLLILHPP